jgi:hypothetical protein
MFPLWFVYKMDGISRAIAATNDCNEVPPTIKTIPLRQLWRIYSAYLLCGDYPSRLQLQIKLTALLPQTN